MIDQVRDLYAYNAWANRQVWDCLASLTDEQFSQPLDYSVGSLRTQALHTLGVQSWWIHYLRTGEIVFLDDDAFTDRASIRARWDEVDTETADYLAGITDADLGRLVRPAHWGDARPPVTVWQALFQVLNHSTDHRAQTLAGIFQLGGETIAQDYLLFAWDHPPRG